MTSFDFKYSHPSPQINCFYILALKDLSHFTLTVGKVLNPNAYFGSYNT